MRKFYTIIIYISLPFILLRLLWRARNAPEYAKRWAERFGFFPAPPHPCEIWVHAVSLGEVLAAAPLIKGLLQQHPDKKIVVTTMTPTGSERVQALFGEQVFHVYVPYDFPDAITRFLQRTKPKTAIFIETELWPNIFAACTKRNIAIVIANARLSQRSAAGYAKVAALTKEMLASITLLAVQTAADGERFIQLGLAKEKMVVTGSVKFDISIPENLPAKGQALRTKWGSDRPVWIAASTHEGEEQQILAAHAKVRETVSDALLILVPRHPERFAKVASLSQQAGWQTVLRTTEDQCSADTDVFLGNTMGEMLLFFAASDVAFVGGSLIERGGHNLLEPAALSLPTITGPHVFNFVEVNHLLQQADALFTVADQNELAQTVIALFQNAEKRQQVGSNGEKVVAQNRGALEKHLRLLAGIINAEAKQNSSTVAA